MRTQIDRWVADFPDARDAGVDLWARVRRGDLAGPESRFALEFLAQAPGDTFSWPECVEVLNAIAGEDLSDLEFRAIDSLIEKCGRDEVAGIIDPVVKNFVSLSLVAHGMRAASDLEDHEIEMCAALLLGKTPRPFVSEVLGRALGHAEQGRALSRAAALASTVEVSDAQTLDRALHYATPEEALRIVLRTTETSTFDHVWELMETRRDDMSLALLGERLESWDRAFGPDTKRLLFGATGVLGFPGFAGVCAALIVAPLGISWLTLLAFLLSTFGTRYAVNRPLGPRLASEDLPELAHRGAAAGLVAAWIVHEARRENRPPPFEVYAILENALDDAPAAWIGRARGSLFGEQRHLRELSERQQKRHLEAIRRLETSLDATRRTIAANDPRDPRALADALVHTETRASAARALDSAPRSNALAAAAMDALAEEPTTDLLPPLMRYVFRMASGEQLRLETPTPDLHRRLDAAFAKIARDAELQVRLKSRLIWASGDLVTTDAQALMEAMLNLENRTDHCAALIDACTHLTPGSRNRVARELREKDESSDLFLAALGDDPTMWDLAGVGAANASVILRRHAGAGAMLGLWRLARSNAPATERRAAYQGLLELTHRYRKETFELLDEAIATTSGLTSEGWAEVAHARLSDAMIARTRWAPSAWRRTVGRPDMLEFARAVIWGIYDPYDRLVKTYRVDESNELVDQHDEGVTLSGHLAIGVVCPVDVDDRLRDVWSEVFADYELVSPIAQLLAPSEPVDVLPSLALRRLVSERGWISGHPDHGRVFAFLRPFLELDCTALIEFEPGLGEDDEAQDVAHLSFIEGVHFEESAVPTRAEEGRAPLAFAAARMVLEEDLVWAASAI